MLAVVPKVLHLLLMNSFVRNVKQLRGEIVIDRQEGLMGDTRDRDG